MPVRGQKPKPTALKIIQGNPGKKPLNKNEPKPSPRAPECPSWLTPYAKEEWYAVADELEKLGLLTRVDKSTMTGYAVAFGTARKAQDTIQAEGLTFTTETGYIREHPEVGVAHRAWSQVRAFAQEMGMTPAARSRISVPSKPDEGELKELLS